MQSYLWKTTKTWQKSFDFFSGRKEYSVELVRLKKWWGEKFRIFTNGLEIDCITFKRLNGLAVCHPSEQYSWEFDGRSFLLMMVPGTCSVEEYHLFIDGFQVNTDDTPSTIWRRRGWVLICHGVMEVLIGVTLEAIRYIEDLVPCFLLWELLGRALLIFGFLKIVEGLISPAAIHNYRFGPVYTV